MKQRVMIAMALTHDPPLLILDEPTSALDVSIQAQIMNLLKELKRERGIAMLFITHDLALASDLCDRIAVVYAGQLRELGSAEAVIGDPRDPYTRAADGEHPAAVRGHGARVPAGLAARPAPAAGGVPVRGALSGGVRAVRRAAAARGGGAGASRALLAGAGGECHSCGRAGAGWRPMTELLRLEHVSVDFTVRQGFFSQSAVRAVRDVSLSLERGEHLAVVGESGSGKTTLGRAALRLLPISTGRVLFDGTDVATLEGKALLAFRKRAQVVFQDPYSSLSPYMRVLDLVAEPLVIHGGVSAEERQDRVIAALEAVRLTPAAELITRYPHTLSGGQRQRVSIARAMILEPDFLVADEPVSMIDASIRAEILALLRDLQRTRGLTMLSITHDLASARHSADRIAVMYAGRVVEVAEPGALVRDPRHPYTKALLAAVPEPDPANRLQAAGRSSVGSRRRRRDLPSGCAFRTRCPVAIAGVCEVADPPLVARAGGGLVACHHEPAVDGSHVPGDTMAARIVSAPS